MSGSRAFGKHVVVMIVAAAAFCIAWSGLHTLTADAAPYPPSEPCSVTATARSAAAADGTTEYDVLGTGLGSAQPVRVVLAESGRQVGTAQTDDSGSFRTTVIAPPDADTSAPGFTASSPQQSCTWTPPTRPTTSPPAGTDGPGSPVRLPSANGPAANPSQGPSVSPTSQPGSGAGGRGDGGSGPATPSTGGSAGTGGDATTTAPGRTPTTSSPTSGAATSSAPPLAEPLPGSDTPFGIGLGIAAVLLVLGTLAVLLLTRRPER